MLGLRNGVWRLTFLGTLFSLSAATVHGLRGMPDPGLWFLVGIHLMWTWWAVHVATITNKEVCGILAELEAEDYARQWTRAAAAQPVDHFRVDRTGKLLDVRKPLLDPQMGLSERP